MLSPVTSCKQIRAVLRIFKLKLIFNPFKPNGISHCYLLDQSISVLRVYTVCHCPIRWVLINTLHSW